MDYLHKNLTLYNIIMLKGTTHTIEAKAKMHKAKIINPSWAKGMTFSVEHRQKISEANKGKTAWNKNKKGTQVAWNKGLKTGKGGNTGRTRFIKNDPRLMGANHPNWKGGVTTLQDYIRKLPEYKTWRLSVFERDNYTCVAKDCEKLTTRVQADHIKRFADILKQYNIKTVLDAIACIELWDINNGRTLCIPCHIKTPTYGGKKT